MYSTIEDIKGMVDEGVLINLTDDQSTGSINEARIEEAINDADSEINGYLQKRYPLPLPSTPPVIKKLSKDIALYNLFSRKGIDKNSTDEIILDRYKYAVRFLENLSKGQVSLGIETQVKSTIEISISSNRKLFSRNSLRGM